MLESLDETGRRSASHVKVDSLAVNTPVKSLIILVHQAQPNPRVDVYVDCIYEGSIPLKKTFREIAETEDNPSVEVVSFNFPWNVFYNNLSLNESLRGIYYLVRFSCVHSLAEELKTHVREHIVRSRF